MDIMGTRTVNGLSKRVDAVLVETEKIKQDIARSQAERQETIEQLVAEIAALGGLAKRL